MMRRREAAHEFDFDGLKIRDYTAGLATSSSLAVVTVEPGARHREAWSRRSDKYYYVVAGHVKFVVDGEAHDTGPEDLCVIRQGQRFSYENTSRTPLFSCWSTRLASIWNQRSSSRVRPPVSGLKARSRGTGAEAPGRRSMAD